MNLVDPVLRTSNSGAVLAAVNCFLLLTKDMPDMRYQVLYLRRSWFCTMRACARVLRCKDQPDVGTIFPLATMALSTPVYSPLKA